ncbi:uncharacterized protein BJX67DRAFT_334933 [Aspergillus lucknowensis]|uniref:Peptidase S8/S53 domain-containing protein n=1 Tax=Aspergillus lucknowensis TaxID=176173 RepID=A0ABR4L945_9EURO
MSQIRRVQLQPPDPKDYGPRSNRMCYHGTMVTSFVAGATVGLVPKANIVPVDVKLDNIKERALEGLLRVLDDLLKHPERGPKSVINLSWGSEGIRESAKFRPTMSKRPKFPRP